jgi:tetratricopeptide (TPR) repeat protein
MFKKFMQSVQEFFADDEEGQEGRKPQDAEESPSSNAMLRSATGKIMKGDFDGAIEVYQQLMRNHPDEAGGALLGIGACRSLQGRYLESIGYYRKAREAGYDESTVEENILEAVAKAHKAGDADALNWYRSEYPSVPEGVLQRKIAKAGK